MVIKYFSYINDEIDDIIKDANLVLTCDFKVISGLLFFPYVVKSGTCYPDSGRNIGKSSCSRFDG